MRYVVLHHVGYRHPHFDLMIETAPGSTLMTWRCADWPVVAGDEVVQLADHRRDYLTYEGPVSNNRGDVKRIAGGTCEIAIASNATPPQITIEIAEPDHLLILLREITDPDRASAERRWRVVEVSE